MITVVLGQHRALQEPTMFAFSRVHFTVTKYKALESGRNARNTIVLQAGVLSSRTVASCTYFAVTSDLQGDHEVYDSIGINKPENDNITHFSSTPSAIQLAILAFQNWMRCSHLRRPPAQWPLQRPELCRGGRNRKRHYISIRWWNCRQRSFSHKHANVMDAHLHHRRETT